MTPQEALRVMCIGPQTIGNLRRCESAVDVLRDLLRRDWAVRVLDAHGREHSLAPPAVEREVSVFSIEILCRYGGPEARYIGSLGKALGVSEDVARLRAAERVFEKLTESTRAEIGPKP